MDISLFEKDNLKNCRIEGNVPEETKDEPCWLGIDEAGRGPVLGPMVYGTCYSPLKYKKEVEEIGFADSKTLNEEKREELFVKLDETKDKIGWIIDILSPHTISTGMLGRSKYNLNALSHDTAIGLIQTVLDKEVNVKEVYVDTVGPPDKYQAKLKGIFPKLDITVAKKADATYAIVSAASICAKVGRDKAVKTWKFSENTELKDTNYGSGYPGDPATKRFLVDTLDPVFGFPKFVRFSWSTASNMMDNKAVRINWPDDDEDENSEPAAKKSLISVSTFFQPKPESLARKKHRFFNDRHLKAVAHF